METWDNSDSAGGNMKDMRDNEFQAILSLRGKPLNVLTASIDKIKANQEIMSIVNAIGLDYNPDTMKMVYDKSRLRYGKIIVASDADVDGQMWASEKLFA